MIEDQKHIDYFKNIARELYLSNVLSDYGNDKKDLLIQLTETISDIYKHLQYNAFKNVLIYISVENKSSSLSSILTTPPLTILSYENLSQLSGNNIVIEVKSDGNLDYSIDSEFSINSNRENAIIYSFKKETETEIIFGKTNQNILPKIPDSDSYFAIQTYKKLNLALEDYGSKIARYSECVYLKNVWADENRIFFKPKPEHILRDSLTDFLKKRLRNTEVRPEQIVDTSHPVDIKVTWSLASHLALIEIKWIGQSIKNGKASGYTKQRAINRVNSGAKQLADYLDENQKQAPTKTTKGYLVTFDARREYDGTSTELDRARGLKYVNDNILLAPDYHTSRPDFAKPVRFFMEHSITN